MNIGIGDASVVLKETEIENEVAAFIKGWAYCRKLPCTEIKTTGLVKKVKFEVPVYGRDLEYFYFYNKDTLPVEFHYFNRPHWATIFSDNRKIIKEMEDLGYELRANEYLMRLSPINKTERYKFQKHIVEKVNTQKQAKQINNYLGFEKFNPNRIDDPNIQYHFIQMDNKPVCTGVISLVDGDSCLDRIHTNENYRGLGLASSLCYSMLESCLKAGITRNVLGSSEMGSHLYKKLGYETVIPMYVFEKAIADKLI